MLSSCLQHMWTKCRDLRIVWHSLPIFSLCIWGNRVESKITWRANVTCVCVCVCVCVWTLQKPVPDAPYIHRHHRVCTYSRIRHMTARLPGCQPNISPLYHYPMALHCHCAVCSTQDTECETFWRAGRRLQETMLPTVLLIWMINKMLKSILFILCDTWRLMT